MKTMRRQGGFTLVEIAIVLVVIGLLLGGVLKGQELIKNTKVKNIWSQYQQLAAATYAYQDRYKAIPGDDPLATKRGFTAGTTAIADGNGNGWIDGGIWCPTGSPAESCQALYQLRLGGFITGSDTIAPTHAFGGRVSLTRGDNMIAGYSKPTTVCFEWLNNETARMLESDHDDSVFSTGSMRGSADYMAAGAIDAVSSQYNCIAF